MDQTPNDFKVWVDGSVIRGHGGWAYILKAGEHDKETIDSGHIRQATNNQAELHAIKEALKCPLIRYGDNIIIYTDSNYAIGVLQNGHRVRANSNLVLEIRELMKNYNTILAKIAAKSNYESKKVDSLANLQAKILPGKKVLPPNFEGENYIFNINTFTDIDGNIIFYTEFEGKKFNGETPYEAIIELCSLLHRRHWKS